MPRSDCQVPLFPRRKFHRRVRFLRPRQRLLSRGPNLARSPRYRRPYRGWNSVAGSVKGSAKTSGRAGARVFGLRCATGTDGRVNGTSGPFPKRAR
jgi:hypothetical protein